MYNEQLLQSSGSIKEFESLIKEFPGMQKGMQIKYNQTREHRTQLIGKINTLESLIKQYHFEDLTWNWGVGSLSVLKKHSAIIFVEKSTF